MTVPDRMESESLRQRHYNAEVIDVREVHDELRIFRIRPDSGRLDYLPGQYTALGLGSWEPRVAGTQAEPPSEPHLIRRPYSICSRMLDASGQIARRETEEDLEFYVTLVRRAAEPPALTPRLFLLEPGSRLYVGPRGHGRYSLEGVGPTDRIALVATGTGEAPHNAMLAELLGRGHQGAIVSVHCVRYEKDRGYLETHRRLEQMFPNYRYLSLTTREPRNLDRSRPDFIGKQYVQDFLASGELEKACGWQFDPQNTHVFLCGGPDMIGAPQRSAPVSANEGAPKTGQEPQRKYNSQRGMVETLEARGFWIDLPHRAGNIHFETWW